jgi:uncharacterized membrane protein (UPF0182 family)
MIKEEPMGNQFHLTRRGRLLPLIFGAAVLGMFILAMISGGIQNWLWMKQLDYSVIFWTLLSVKWQMFCAAFVVAFLYLWINLRLAAKKGTVFREDNPAGSSDIVPKIDIQVSPAGLKLAMPTVSVVVAFFFAFVFYAQWDTYLRFRYGGCFGLADPLFGADVGFYLFRLPFYELVQNSLTGLTLVTLLLMTPFSPQNRDNIVAWMAARCDFPEYGRILVYQLPKDKLVLGPIQIEAMIDQNTTISQQLSLWDQKGSQVTRGNLIVIPIENSFL